MNKHYHIRYILLITILMSTALLTAENEPSYTTSERVVSENTNEPPLYKGFNIFTYFHYGHNEKRNNLLDYNYRNFNRFDYLFVSDYVLGFGFESSIPHVDFIKGVATLEITMGYENRRFIEITGSNKVGTEWHYDWRYAVRQKGWKLSLGANWHIFSEELFELYMGGQFSFSQMGYTTNNVETFQGKILFGMGAKLYGGVHVRILPPFSLMASVGMDLQDYGDGVRVQTDTWGRVTNDIPDGSIFFTHREFFFTIGVAARFPFTKPRFFWQPAKEAYDTVAIGGGLYYWDAMRMNNKNNARGAQDAP